MVRALLIVAIALLYSAPSMAADMDPNPSGIQYSLVTQSETEFGNAKPIVWVDDYALFSETSITIDKNSSNGSLDRGTGYPGAGIGMGVAPLFGKYGVVRTGSNKKSTYVVLGFAFDELTEDEADEWDYREEPGLSYGIGVNNDSFNVEYMMSVDENNYGVSAVGLGITSKF